MRHSPARQGDVDTVVGELVCERDALEIGLALCEARLELLARDVEVLAGLTTLLRREAADVAQGQGQRRVTADRGDADVLEGRQISSGIDLREARLEGASFAQAFVSGCYLPAELSPAEMMMALEHGTRVRYGV